MSTEESSRGGKQVIIDSGRFVWKLWAALAGWSVLFGPGIPAFGVVGYVENPYVRTTLVVIGACLLSVVVTVSLVRCLSQRVPTFGAIGAAVGAVAIFCALVGVAFWTNTISHRMGTRFSFATAPTTLDRMQRLPSGRFGARMAYQELGLRIVYRDKAGATTVFEPTSTEQKERRENVALQWRLVHSVPEFERDDRTNHVSAWILALSFPLVFTLYLLWLKQRGHYVQDNDEPMVAHGPWTYRAITAAAVGLAGFFVVVGAIYSFHAQEEELIGVATQPYAWLTPGKLDGIHELKNPTNRRLAARMMFYEFGWRTGYRDEAGAMVAFEPTSDQRRIREETVSARKDLANAVANFDARTDRERTFVWRMLMALPSALAVGLLWRKRRSSVA